MTDQGLGLAHKLVYIIACHLGEGVTNNIYIIKIKW